MPTHVGPNISGEENLVFGYNLSDQKNSYLGEPTTNQANTDYARTIQFHNQGSYNNAGTISDAPEKGTDWKKIVITDRGNNFRIAQFPYIIQTYGTTKVYSVEYDFGLTSGYFFYGDGSSGFGVLQDDGKRTTARFTPPSSSDWYEALFLGHNTPASGINDTIYYRYYQVEEKSYPTRYTPTSRSSTQGLLDLKGTSTINISTTSFDNSSQLIFDGSDDYITLSSTSHPTGSCSMEIVINHTHNFVGTRYLLYGASGTAFSVFFRGDWAGNLLYFTRRVTSSGNYGDSAWGYTTGIYQPIPANETMHLIFTHDASTGEFKCYKNGILTRTVNGNLAAYGALNTTQQSHYIGGTPGDNLPMTLPLFKFHDRVLSSSEVLNNYNNTKRKYGI
jgi:hypothetical protein